MIALRKQHLAFGRGTLEPLTPRNRKVFAFIRRYGEETCCSWWRTCRAFAQYVELDLSEFRGVRRSSCSAKRRFRRSGDRPYVLTLGPHSFYWFSLRKSERLSLPSPLADDPPRCEVSNRGTSCSTPGAFPAARILPRYLPAQRWFRSQVTRNQERALLRECVPRSSDQ